MKWYDIVLILAFGLCVGLCTAAHASDYDAALTKLGAPMVDTTLGDGTRTLTYMSMNAHAKAVSFVPIVGMFAGGASSRSVITTYTFDTTGKLISEAHSNINVNCRVGFGGANCK